VSSLGLSWRPEDQGTAPRECRVGKGGSAYQLLKAPADDRGLDGGPAAVMGRSSSTKPRGRAAGAGNGSVRGRSPPKLFFADQLSFECASDFRSEPDVEANDPILSTVKAKFTLTILFVQGKI
jgi:hypothetical protein